MKTLKLLLLVVLLLGVAGCSEYLQEDTTRKELISSQVVGKNYTPGYYTYEYKYTAGWGFSPSSGKYGVGTGEYKWVNVYHNPKYSLEISRTYRNNETLEEWTETHWKTVSRYNYYEYEIGDNYD